MIYQGFGLGALSGSFIASALGGFVPTFTFIGVFVYHLRTNRDKL